MKPPSFDYDSPETIPEALALLAEHGDDAKVIAGGQSLIPLLNFRLARPQRLVDVNRLSELEGVTLENGRLRIGALTRHSALERSGDAAAGVPLLTQAVRLVGHRAIRNRGTVGGSAAHADPTAELPVAFAALGASFRMRSSGGERVLAAHEFFRTYLTTALNADELLVEVEVPVPAPGTGHAFVEFARRSGDFALGGVAALVRLAAGGAVETAAIALLGCAPTPLRRPDVEEWLVGQPLDGRAAEEAARRAVADVQPPGDVHGGSDYRRELVRTLVREALLRAAGTAAA